MSEYITHTTRVVLLPKGEPIFSERATTVEIDDEAGREYVTVSQDTRDGFGKIAIEPAEWPALRELIEKMIGDCRS